jgi:chromosome segregation ATPase
MNGLQVSPTTTVVLLLAAMLAAVTMLLYEHLRNRRAARKAQELAQAHEREVETLRKEMQELAQVISRKAQESQREAAASVKRLQRLQTQIAEVGRQTNAPAKVTSSDRMLQATHRHLQAMLQEQAAMTQLLLTLEVDVQAAQRSVAEWEVARKSLNARHTGAKGTNTQALRQANQALMVELKELRQSARAKASQVTAAREQLAQMEAALMGVAQADAKLIADAVDQAMAGHRKTQRETSARVASLGQELAQVNTQATRLSREVEFIQDRAQREGV